MSAEWLFGHGALKPEMAEYFGFLDLIDVEPGLTWLPDANAFREKAGRPVCVLGGLECYYAQPPEVLRWRVYEAMRQGVNDLGICPSGMLCARPESVSLLRELYAQTAAMQEMLALPAPKVATTCDNQVISIWERQTAAGRDIVAMRNPGDETEPIKVGFTLPAAARGIKLLFEPRKVTVSQQTFTDVFDRPYAVHVYRVTQ